jgi:hypothetical protein
MRRWKRLLIRGVFALSLKLMLLESFVEGDCFLAWTFIFTECFITLIAMTVIIRGSAMRRYRQAERCKIFADIP